MTKYPPAQNDCYPNYSNLYSITFIVLLFFIPLALLLVINVIIMCELHKRDRAKSRHTNRHHFAAVAAVAAIGPIQNRPSGGVEVKNMPISCYENTLDGESIIDKQQHKPDVSQPSESFSQQQTQQTRTNNSNIPVTKSPSRFSRERKALIALVFTQTALVICWTPYLVILPMVNYCDKIWCRLSSRENSL